MILSLWHISNCLQNVAISAVEAALMVESLPSEHKALNSITSPVYTGHGGVHL